jgi:transglutaminase-like putative cysteine protease
MGLVYLEAGQRLAYHMWTEVWVDGRWRPLDATLGQGGIGAGHLKLATSALAGEAAYTSLLPVLQVVGRLKISLVEAE